MDWNELVRAAWLGPVVGGLITATAAVLGIFFTQLATDRREERNRIIREKREAYIGSLDAHRDYRIATSELELINSLIAQYRKSYAEAKHAYDSLGDDDEHGLIAKESMEYSDQKLTALLAERLERTVRNAQAFRNLTYWVSRIEIACSPDGVPLLTALIDSSADESEGCRSKYVGFIKADLATHKRLKKSLPAYAPKGEVTPLRDTSVDDLGEVG